METFPVGAPAQSAFDRTHNIPASEVEAGVEASALAVTISQSRASQLATALSKAQGDFTSVPKDKTARVEKEGRLLYSYKFADWGDMLKMALPVLSKHGLALTQPLKRVNGKLLVVSQLRHSSGAVLEDDGLILPEGLEPQKLAGYLTYYRRFGGSTLLGISAEEDTDAPPEETKKAGALPTNLGRRVSKGVTEAAKPVPEEVEKPTVQKMDGPYKRAKEENDRLQVHIKKHGLEPVKSFILKESGAANADSLTQEQWATVLQKLDQGALEVSDGRR